MKEWEVNMMSTNDGEMKLSIIVPAYNCEKYIGNCIESLINALMPTKVSFEIIVINDGSSDKTAEIIRDYEAHYSFIVYIEQKNQGVSIARNNGLSIAKGEYVTFIDADDYVIPDKYREVCLKTCENEYDISCFGMNESGGNGKNNGTIEFDHFEKYQDFIRYPVYMNSVCNKIFKKSIIEKYKIRFEKGMVTCEDLVFVIELFVRTNRIQYLDPIAYTYCRNEMSATNKGKRSVMCREEYKASNKINMIAKEMDLPGCDKVADYWRMVSAMRHLKDIETYDINSYRQKNPEKRTWDYTFKPSYWILSICANKKIDVVPWFYMKLKKMKYS